MPASTRRFLAEIDAAKPSMPTLLRIDEAAKVLNLSPKTLRNRIYLREIEIVRIGRGIRIPAEAITQMIEAGRVPARKAEEVA